MSDKKERNPKPASRDSARLAKIIERIKNRIGFIERSGIGIAPAPFNVLYEFRTLLAIASGRDSTHNRKDSRNA